MEDLIIEKTQQSPEIKFKCNGEFLISGVSTFNYAQKFYTVLLTWLDDFKEKKPVKIYLIFQVYYLNTSSALMFVELLRKINSFKSDETKVHIIWRYEEDDEDILNFGEEIQLVTDSVFEFVSI